MKKKMKRCMALVLSVAMMCTFSVNVMAAEADEFISEEYYTADGTFVEKIEFEENEEYAAVIKKTYADGTFDVTSINGTESVTLKGTITPPVMSVASQFSQKEEAEITAVTYPHYTPYWYAGCDEYSQNGVALTVAGIAGVLAASIGISPKDAFTVATTIYAALGNNIYNNVYYRTCRYYATLENGPGLPTVWYNKFVTYVYSNASRTKLISGPHTEIYESGSPM